MTITKTGVLFGVLLILVVSYSSINHAQENKAYVIPDLKNYHQFLLNKWKPGAPTLLAIKDPFCPYCIRDLKRRSQLQNYNVFLFWAPILNEQSTNRVKEYFHCASPIDELVIDAAINRLSPQCDGILDDNQFDLNNGIIANYRPNSVPQYWLGGKRVSLSNLNLYRPEVVVEDIIRQSLIKIDWSRYQNILVNAPPFARHNIIILLPDSYELNVDILASILNSPEFNWYLSINTLESKFESWFWCQQKSQNCTVKAVNRDADYYGKELQLLTGLETLKKPTFLLEGKVLSDREIAFIVPRNIRDILL